MSTNVNNYGDSFEELLKRRTENVPLPNYTKGCSVCYGSGFDVAGKPCPFACKPASDATSNAKEQK